MNATGTRSVLTQVRAVSSSVSAQRFARPLGTLGEPAALSRPQRESAPSWKARSFHSTPQREILPLVAGAAVLLIGRYSWKALSRMDAEWEDYLWEMKRYERDRLRNPSAAGIPLTIGVDLGTIYLKLSTMKGTKPELIETAQGDRYRFNGILTQPEGSNDEKIVTGKAALDKFYYYGQEQGTNSFSASDVGNVTLPYMLLQKESHSSITKLIQKVFLPAVGEAMDQVTSDAGRSGDSASSDESGIKKNLRTVLTLPPPFYNQHGETVFRNFHDGSHHTITVPEPVAAIWGAQVLNLIPTPQSKEENESFSTLVVDVGGLASTVSLVRDDRVVASVTLDNVGGESLVRQLVDRILKETGDEGMAKDAMALTMIQSSARSSVFELVNKTQTQVHIPFLYMGRKPDSPHLDTTVSRTALEQAVQDYWNTVVIPSLVNGGTALSSSLPPPSGATSLFTSAITRVLEDGNEIPTKMDRILLVGGGSKFKLFEDAFRESIFALMGPQQSSGKVIVPQTSLRAELTALGAASLLPNFDYDYEKGLESTSQ